MHSHFVLAHPEPQSFNAQLVQTGSAALRSRGWTVSVSDLYAMGFDPCEWAALYGDPAAQRFDVQSTQRRAAEANALPGAVTDELALLDRADLLGLQYPMWWRLPPAILKGWFDRVFAYGEVYTSSKRFEFGRFTGKRAMLSACRALNIKPHFRSGLPWVVLPPENRKSFVSAATTGILVG